MSLETVRDRALREDAAEIRSAVTDLIRVYSFRDRDQICCHDLSVTQSNALDILGANGPLTLNALAAELFLDKSTASRVVDTLERKGYAARRENPESRRSILIDLTDEGERLRQAIERDLVEEEMELLEDFGPEARRTAATIIRRLARAAAARVDTTGGNCCSVR